MIKKTVAALSLALVLVPFVGSAASAQDVVDSGIVDRIECLFRVYINEGGEGGLDCLT